MKGVVTVCPCQKSWRRASFHPGPPPRDLGISSTSLNAIYFSVREQIGMKRVALSTSLLPHRQNSVRLSSIAITPLQQRYPHTNKRSFTSTAMADRPTLVKPPPIDPSKSSIENVLELTELSAIAPVGLLSLYTPSHSHASIPIN